jgi:hypothetical protein
VSLRWPDGFTGAQAALELAPGCHVSYPFVFAYRGRILMAPETRQKRRLSLWSQDPVGAWHELQCLADDAALADPTLVRHGDRWWLFCCEQTGAPDTRLLIYFAPEPTSVISDAIPPEADALLERVRRVPLDAPLDRWVGALRTAVAAGRRPDAAARLVRSVYAIDRSVALYAAAYEGARTPQPEESSSCAALPA